MKHSILFIFIIYIAIHTVIDGKVIIVDRNGLGQYTTIQAGINAAVLGDTVKVLPGEYEEQVTLSKPIVVQGSGYEYTRITSNASQTLAISAGKIMWFSISSNVGDAVQITGGTITNCVIWNSSRYGVVTGTNAANAVVMNCVIMNNGSYGAYVSSGSLSIINTIFYKNRNSDLNQTASGIFADDPSLLYCRAYQYDGSYKVGIVTSNPAFISTADLKLQPSSPCIDAGKPDVSDPDGSRSDIGYYGGPDAPVFPVVTNLHIILNPDGTVKVRAIAQSRY